MAGVARGGAPGKFKPLSHGLTHYELDGDTTRPLLICIHGWTTASYVWDPLKPFLRDMGYRILSYDLYGRGYSDRPIMPQTASLFSSQLTELLEALRLERHPVSVVGYSMGGAIAARFASERLDQIRRMLLIAPAGMAVRAPGPRNFARRNPQLVDPHILTLLPLVLRRQFQREADRLKTNVSVQRIAQKQLRELEFRGYLPSLLSSLKGVLAANMRQEHLTISKSPIRIRALFASEDTTIPHPRAKDLFDQWHPGMTPVSHLIKGVGHAVPYTHPHLVLENARDILEDP